MAEMAALEIQVNNCFGGASGFLPGALTVPQESVDFRVATKFREPVYILHD
jgi:hypothetical protein